MTPPATKPSTVSVYALFGVFWRAGWLGTLYGGAVGAVVGLVLMIFSSNIGFALLGALWGFFLGGTGGFVSGVFGPGFGGTRGYSAAGFLGGVSMSSIWWPPTFAMAPMIIDAQAIFQGVMIFTLFGLAGALTGFVIGKEMERGAPRFSFWPN